MIIKADQAKNREFKGVLFDLLSVGQKSMITKMKYKREDIVPFHSHPNEQNGYVISGKYRIRFGNYDEVIQAGDSYSIPADSEHSIEVIESGEIVDVFTPVRKDYL